MGFLQGAIQMAATKVKHTNRIQIIADIDSDSYQAFSNRLAELEAKKVRHVEIELNSGGGSVYDAIAFYSRMRGSPCAFTVTAYGIVASAAVIILVAGTKRRIAEETWVMVHEDSGGTPGTTSVQEAHAKHMRRLENQWNMIMSKLTKRDSSFWEKIHKTDKYLTAKQCVELGIADEVI